MSSSNYSFLTCIQVSQEAGNVVWYSHLLKNFPQFIVNHTVKGFGIVNKAEIEGVREQECLCSRPGPLALNLTWILEVSVGRCPSSCGQALGSGARLCVCGWYSPLEKYFPSPEHGEQPRLAALSPGASVVRGAGHLQSPGTLLPPLPPWREPSAQGWLSLLLCMPVQAVMTLSVTWRLPTSRGGAPRQALPVCSFWHPLSMPSCPRCQGNRSESGYNLPGERTSALEVRVVSWTLRLQGRARLHHGERLLNQWIPEPLKCRHCRAWRFRGDSRDWDSQVCPLRPAHLGCGVGGWSARHGTDLRL